MEDENDFQFKPEDIDVIRVSIESGTVLMPDWVKSGKDFVKWIRERKEMRDD